MEISKKVKPEEFDHWLRATLSRKTPEDEQLYERVWQRIEKHIVKLNRVGCELGLGPNRKITPTA